MPMIENTQLDVYVNESPEKGRILRSKRSFRVGEVIFREKATVYASWELDICSACDVAHPTGVDEMSCAVVNDLFGESIASQLHELVDFLVELEAVGEVDRARMLLKCIAMFVDDPQSFQEILNLSFVNLPKCVQAAQLLYQKFPDIVPQEMSVVHIATVLAVLNTNSHELEQLHGSGLFPTACMMEHSCVPSCNFTTFGNELWITAIQRIDADQALSIDYGNFFYRPRTERQEVLQNSYGFECTCTGCTKLPDRTRAFVCHAASDRARTKLLDDPKSKCNGIVCPCPNGKWTCIACGSVLTDSERDGCVAAEQESACRDFLSLDQIDAVIDQHVLHATHHSLFFALEQLGLAAAQDAECPSDLVIEIWERIVSAAMVVVPTPHSEKVMYFDRLGQIRACLGDVKGARDAYGMAYQESMAVSGAHSETTAQLYQLYQNPPRSRAETIARYASSSDGGRAQSRSNQTRNLHEFDMD